MLFASSSGISYFSFVYYSASFTVQPEGIPSGLPSYPVFIDQSVPAGFIKVPEAATLSNQPTVQHSAETVDEVIVTIGDNGMRKRVAEKLRCKFAKGIVHPKAVFSHTASIGEGSVVMAGAVVNAGTVIGNHSVINTCASVDHECQIGDYVHIAPGAHLCGLIQVGEGTLIGAGASVIPCVKIGRWCTIGAGAAVVSDVPDGATVVGVPGRIVWRTSVPNR